MKIQNITFLVIFDQRLPLDKLTGVKSVWYGVGDVRRRFSGYVYKDSGVTFLLYEVGKAVCVGAKEVDAANGIIQKLANQMGIGIVESRITNLVASQALGYHLHLPTIYESCRKWASYEPELFAGLILRPPVKGTLVIHHTGKLHCTGVISLEQACALLECAKPYLKSI